MMNLLGIFSIIINQMIDSQKKLFNVQTSLYDKDIGICCSCEEAFHGKKSYDDKFDINSNLNMVQETINLLKKIPDDRLLEKIKLTLPDQIKSIPQKK